MPSKEAWRRQFYNSTAWKRKRSYILLRDHYLCQEHLRLGRLVPAVLVHHIKHLDVSPELELIDCNLESLCVLCHERKHGRRGSTEKVLPPNGVRIIKA